MGSTESTAQPVFLQYLGRSLPSWAVLTSVTDASDASVSSFGVGLAPACSACSACSCSC